MVPHRLPFVLLRITYSTLICINGDTHDNHSLYFGIRSILTRDFYIRSNIYAIMKQGMFFTTMVNHRPVYAAGPAPASAPASASAPLQPFRATAARDPTDTNTANPNNPPQPALRDLLARSTQPVFSVSAMFRIKAGGGCGACGH